MGHQEGTRQRGRAMTLATVELASLIEAARAAGLDGRDRGAVRRLIWSELGSDAVDHAVVSELSDRLVAADRLGAG